MNYQDCIYCFFTKTILVKFTVIISISIIGVGAGKFLGVRRILPNYPKLSRNVFVPLLPTDFLPQRTRIPVFGVTPRKVLIVFFCERWVLQILALPAEGLFALIGQSRNPHCGDCLTLLRFNF